MIFLIFNSFWDGPVPDVAERQASPRVMRLPRPRKRLVLLNLLPTCVGFSKKYYFCARYAYHQYKTLKKRVCAQLSMYIKSLISIKIVIYEETFTSFNVIF